MSTQATRTAERTPTSGAFEAEWPRDVIVEAHRLACEIERLLSPVANELEPYAHRLARALSQNLIDQLEEVARDRWGPKRLA
jgi:hypothetical protein